MDLLVLPKIGADVKKEITKMELYEYIPVSRIQAAINALGDNVEIRVNGHTYTWTDQRTWLLKYLKKTRNNFHRTIYTNNKNGKAGRVRPKDEMGTICMRRDVRNFLMQDYYDIDMRNCHVSIMLSVLQTAGIPEDKYETWLDYHTRREEILHSLGEEFPEEDWKQFFTSLLFYGHHDQAKRHPYLSKLVNELYDITEIIKQNNPDFYQYTSRLEKKHKFHMGCFLSHYLQEHEYRIMEEVFTFLYYQNEWAIRFKGHNVLSYEFDGFKVLKQNIPDMDQFLRLVNGVVQKKYPYVGFVEKEMKEVLKVEEQVQDMTKYETLSSMTDENIVDILEEMEKNNLMYDDNKWFYFHEERWILYEKEPHKFVDNMKRIVLRFFETNVPESNSVLWDKIHEKIYCLETNKVRKQVLTMCKSRFYVKDAFELFNTKEMLLGFENGVYDLERQEFRDYRYDDYVTSSVGYKYTERDEEQIEFLKTLLRKIHPDPADYELMMTLRASGLCGKNVEKFILLNGKGRNGKGLVNTLQQHAMGKDYAMVAEPSLLTNPIPKNELSVAHAKMDNKRFIIVKEPCETEKLNNATIKSITGGGEISARTLYSSRNVVRQTWTLFCECNERPSLQLRPGVAEIERWIDVYHPSNFGDNNKVDDEKTNHYVPNVYFKTIEFRKKYSMAFLHILLEYFQVWKKNNYIFQLSPSVIRRSQEYMLDCNPVHKFFSQLYEPQQTTEGTHIISIESIYELILDQREITTLTKVEKRLLSKPNIVRYLQDRGIEVQYPDVPLRARMIGYKRILSHDVMGEEEEED